MPSPFPGMDPFLEEESLWPWFQHQLAVTLQQMLSAKVGDQYQVQICQRSFRLGDEEQCEEYVQVHTAVDGRLVTLLDIVSPADKLTDAGRKACQATRQAARESGASIVEIDLVLRGECIRDYSLEGLPDWDYAVTVTRGTVPDRHEIYTSAIEKRLPRFRFPLARNERDIVVDLQDAFRRAYDDCGFGSRINYRMAPKVSLSMEVQERVARMLNEPTS